MTPVTQTISPAGDSLAAADGLTNNSVRIRPITPVFGAFIENLPWTAASDESDPALIRIIKEAFDKYLVLMFEPQEASAQALRSFVRQFGPLFVHHADDGVRQLWAPSWAYGVLPPLSECCPPDGGRALRVPWLRPGMPECC